MTNLDNFRCFCITIVYIDWLILSNSAYHFFNTRIKIEVKTMSEYLNVPFYYTALHRNIFSATLNEVLQKEDLLDYLRQVYQSDIGLFYNIRDEFLLRGIEFKKDYQNNVFPALQYEIKNIISKDQPGEQYLKIDNTVTGIRNLINRYKAESDYFFVNVPLEGLAYSLNKDASFLAKQLEKVGYTIVPVEKYTAKDVVNLQEVPIDEEQETPENTAVEGETLIDDCFVGGEFLAFTRYCNRHEKKFFSQLTIDFIEKFQHVRSVGVTKYKRVLERYEELEKELGNSVVKPKKLIKMTPIEYIVDNPLRNVLELKNISYSDFLNSIYMVEDEEIYSTVPSEVFDDKREFVLKLVDELNEEETERQFCELQDSIRNHENYAFIMEMTKGNIRRLFNLQISETEENIHLFEMIEDRKYSTELISIYNEMMKYKPINLQIAEINNVLDERQWEVILNRLHKTLQEVGEIVGVTRERVRQIEYKAMSKLKHKIKKLKLEIYFNHFLQNSVSMLLEAFMDKLKVDASYKDVFTICVSLTEELELANGTIINKNLYEYVQEHLGVIRGWTKTILDASEVLDLFNSKGQYEFTVQTIDKVMDELGFKRKNALYFKRNIKMPDQIAYLFKYKIKGSLEMTDDAFEHLQSLMIEVFDDQFENGKRAAVARVRDTKNVILVDGNTYMYYDLDTVSQELIDQIGNAIEEALVVDDMVSANTLYQRYIDTWKKYNINTHYHLYSILQYHFDSEYVIGKGNTLGIFRSSEAKVDTEYVLIDYLEREGGIRSKKDILDYFHWTPYKLEQLTARSRNLIVVEEEGIEGYGIKLFSSLGFTDNEIDILRSFIDDFMEEEYLFPMELFVEMEFDDQLSEILSKGNITNLYTFVSLLKWLKPDLRGFPQFLYLKDSKITTFEQAVSQIFDKLVRRDELEEFYVEKGYSGSGISGLIISLLEDKSFYNYTSYQYINAKQIMFNEEVKESLRVYLEKSFGNKNYLSALDLTGYSTELVPVSSYAWQPQLICAFVEKVGYRYIRTTSDYRYNKWIIVKENLNVQNYEELVHFVITNEYEGSYHERHIAQFLVDRKLAHTPHQLPVEIKTSKYFVLKDLGFIEVKER